MSINIENKMNELMKSHQMPPEVNFMGADILNTELWIGS